MRSCDAAGYERVLARLSVCGWCAARCCQLRDPPYRGGLAGARIRPTRGRSAGRGPLSRLRTLGRRKESYVGPWLPEPLLTAPDVAEDAGLADSVSMAMLLVLETLTPAERAVFVLREVFDLAYDEIAEAVGKSPAAVRQIAHRARAHVAARRPRGVVSPAETRDALEAFQRAAETGDLQRLLDILAPDVVFLGDGGGVVQAVLAPVVGAGRVARLLAAGLDRIAAASLQPAQVNGEIDTVIAVRIDDGLITGLYAVRNPREAVAYGAGDHPAPLSLGRRGNEQHTPASPPARRRWRRRSKVCRTVLIRLSQTVRSGQPCSNIRICRDEDRPASDPLARRTRQSVPRRAGRRQVTEAFVIGDL